MSIRAAPAEPVVTTVSAAALKRFTASWSLSVATTSSSRNSSGEILRLPSGSLGLLLLVLLTHVFSAAQQKPEEPSPTPPTAIVSPEVHPDNGVTFRFRDPNAKEVKLALEGAAEAQLMQKDEQGVWSVTTSPLASDYYSDDCLRLLWPRCHGLQQSQRDWGMEP